MAYSRRNPLALMVLETLWEQPAHPYQVVQILKRRGKHEAARLNFGALYGVVASLEKAGLIEAVAVTREGNLPPRTVYRTTDAGVRELQSWTADLVATSVKEFPQHMVGLALLPVLAPDEALSLLDRRADALASRIADSDIRRAGAPDVLPELFSVETAYERALLVADLDFTRRLADRIRDGSLGGLEGWRQLFDGGADPDPSKVAAAFGVPEAFVRGTDDDTEPPATTTKEVSS